MNSVSAVGCAQTTWIYPFLNPTLQPMVTTKPGSAFKKVWGVLKSCKPATEAVKILCLPHHCCCCCCSCWVTSVVSDSVQPHRQKPTRLPRPWDSPGKKWSGLPFPFPMHESEKWKSSRSVMSDSWRPHGLQPTPLPITGKGNSRATKRLLDSRGSQDPKAQWDAVLVFWLLC